MLKSRLCIKTKLCELIEALPQDECQQVINFLSQQSCQNLQTLLIKLLFAYDSHGQEFLTNESLRRLEKYVTNIAQNATKQQQPSQCQATSDVTRTFNYKLNDKKRVMNHDQEKSDEEKNENISINSIAIFPLMKLPIEMMKSICYFTNKFDILIFEQTFPVYFIN